MVIERYWKAAVTAANISGVPATLIYCQWSHETGCFTSELCLQFNNLGGVTQVEENDLPQPDGSFYYMKFADLDEWARYFGKFIVKFDGTTDATSIEQYAAALKNEGYYGDTLENYIDGMKSAYMEAFEC